MGWGCAMLMQSLAQTCAAASTRCAVCYGPLRPRSCLGALATIAAGIAGIPGEARAGADSQLPTHAGDVTEPLKASCSEEGILEEKEGRWLGTKWQTQCLT